MNTKADDRCSAEDIAADVAQARHLKQQAAMGGLRFEVYLPPDMAEWLLGLIEQGIYASPADAAFSIFSEHRDLQPHRDLRQEILRRSVAAAMSDPRASISHAEVVDNLREMIRAPRPEPAVWRKAKI